MAFGASCLERAQILVLKGKSLLSILSQVAVLYLKWMGFVIFRLTAT